MEDIVVVKQDVRGRETWRYSGRVLRRWPAGVLLEASFNRPDLPFHGMLLGQGDRFVELFFSQRWYNIFEIHDRHDDHLKGWYCNVTRPAEITAGNVAYVDLALDLLVFADGRQLVLDEDEFALLEIEEATRQQARSALNELQMLFRSPLSFHLEDVLETPMDWMNGR